MLPSTAGGVSPPSVSPVGGSADFSSSGGFSPVPNCSATAFWPERITNPLIPASSTQMTATTTVMRVNTSPALVPKALCPPAPPSAPASPPPRPRCSRMIRMRNSPSTNSRICSKLATTIVPFRNPRRPSTQGRFTSLLTSGADTSFDDRQEV